jgi:hypothetical protein
MKSIADCQDGRYEIHGKAENPTNSKMSFDVTRMMCASRHIPEAGISDMLDFWSKLR